MDQTSSVLEDSVRFALSERLRSENQIDAAYLLGSAADGCLRPDSDVDIAILPAKGVSFSSQRISELAADLEEICRRPVDPGILHTGNLVYAKEAVARGRILFERNAVSRTEFAMHVLSMYAELQDMRREVIHAYAA